MGESTIAAVAAGHLQSGTAVLVGGLTVSARLSGRCLPRWQLHPGAREAPLVVHPQTPPEMYMSMIRAIHNHIHIHMQEGRVLLPDISITGSSEAILQGQKPPFRLLARAVSSQDGSRASHIRPTVSEPFVVRVSPSSPAVPAYCCMRGAGTR